MGHFKRDCPNKKQGDERKCDGSSNSASVVEEDSNSGDGDMLSVSASNSEKLNDCWVLDSTCSYHMCTHRDRFHSYRSGNFGSVLMGNDVSCKVIGMGSIKFKMFDGVVRTLENVRHVLELKKNLISLGALDTNG